MKPKINAAYITVSDLNRAIEFYEAILDTKLTKFDERMSELKIGDFTLLLYDPKVDSWEPTIGDNTVLNIQVDDVERLLALVKEKECKIVMPVTEIGPDKFFQAEDTEGNIIEFYQVKK